MIASLLPVGNNDNNNDRRMMGRVRMMEDAMQGLHLASYGNNANNKMKSVWEAYKKHKRMETNGLHIALYGNNSNNNKRHERLGRRVRRVNQRR